MLSFTLHLYFNAFVYPCACILHHSNQRAVYRCPLKLALGVAYFISFLSGGC